MKRFGNGVIVGFVLALAIAAAVPITVKLAMTQPNVGVSWQWPPYCDCIANVETSRDLVTWSTVVVVTNPFPTNPAPACGVGFVAAPPIFVRVAFSD